MFVKAILIAAFCILLNIGLITGTLFFYFPTSSKFVSGMAV